MEQILPILLFAVVFYLLFLRPISTRKKEIAAVHALQEALVPGTRIMMASGIYGVVREVHDDTVVLEIASGTDITIAKGAVTSIDEPEPLDADAIGENTETSSQGEE